MHGQNHIKTANSALHFTGVSEKSSNQRLEGPSVLRCTCSYRLVAKSVQVQHCVTQSTANSSTQN